MQQVSIAVSDDVIISTNCTIDEIARGMRQEYAAKLFKDGKLTLVQAADFCGMNMYDFASLLSQADIPVIDYEPEELEQELALFNQ
jgi:predicted HTH domain antitoxin